MRLLVFNLATDLDDPILGFTTGWIRALAQHASLIHVVTMRAGRVDVPGNVRVYSVGKEKGYSEPRRATEFYRILFRILREGGVDGCFSHMMPLFTTLAGPVLKARRIPVITWYAHPSLTWTLKLAHHFSSRMVASVATAYPYRHDKLTVVGQGIDGHLFSPDESAFPEDPPVILCVGRLSPAKDHPTLLRAALFLRRRLGNAFRVIMVGGAASPRDASYIERLHEYAKDLGVQDTVCFKPPVSAADLPYWYRRCTVHVNLTPTGFGDKVAWEAMACGRPCVVANEGFRETLGRHADNLMFRYGDAEDLARALERTLSLGELERQRIGVDLREQVLKTHSLDRLAFRLVDILSGLMERQSSKNAGEISGGGNAAVDGVAKRRRTADGEDPRS